MALEVFEITSSADLIRNSGTITVTFMVPENDDAGTDSLANGFAALHFPPMWGLPFKACPTSASLTEDLETPVDVLDAVYSCSASSVYLTLGESYTWTDGSNYTLTVGGVPTPEYDFTTATCGDVVLSIGSTASGSYAWSDP